MASMAIKGLNSILPCTAGILLQNHKLFTGHLATQAMHIESLIDDQYSHKISCLAIEQNSNVYHFFLHCLLRMKAIPQEVVRPAMCRVQILRRFVHACVHVIDILID